MVVSSTIHLHNWSIIHLKWTQSMPFLDSRHEMKTYLKVVSILGTFPTLGAHILQTSRAFNSSANGMVRNLFLTHPTTPFGWTYVLRWYNILLYALVQRTRSKPWISLPQERKEEKEEREWFGPPQENISIVPEINCVGTFPTTCKGRSPTKFNNLEPKCVFFVESNGIQKLAATNKVTWLISPSLTIWSRILGR